MFSLSKNTCDLIERDILPHLYELNCASHVLPSGATVIDMGVHAPGGWEAARLFTLVTLSGLGEGRFSRMEIGGVTLPTVDVTLSRPQEASLSSQFSAWKIAKSGAYQLPGFGSGPARALARDDGVARMWHYQDRYHKTALAIQSAELPGDALAEEISARCGVTPENIYLLAATTGSLVGCVQIAARMPEVSLWGLGHQGFPLERVVSFSGYGPVPPVTSDELVAMDRVNTATLYGSVARYTVDCEDAEIARVMPHMAFSDTRHFGRTFAEIYDEAERDIFKMDVDVHKVAVVEVTNLRTGRTFKAGRIGGDMLLKSYFGSGENGRQ